MTTASLARPPLPRLTRVELRKSADTRAGFWLMLVLVLLAAAVVVLQAVFAEDIDRHFEPLLSSAIQVVSVILPVLGILLVTSEWSQRTGLTTFALVPQRERVIVAKVIGAAILTLFAVAACVVVAAIGNLFTGGDWSLGAGELGRLTLYELIGMLGGVAFGLAFLNSALAIVMYFVIPIGWSILGETVPCARQAGRLAGPEPADDDARRGPDDRHRLGPARHRGRRVGGRGVRYRTAPAAQD